MAYKVLTGLMILFFVMFPHYSSYVTHPGAPHGLFHYFFTLFQFVSNQTLGIVHEAGHGVCYILPCPQWLTAANGTIFQLLFPAGVAWYYWKQGERYWGFFALFFVGFSLQYTAWYISTAHEGLHLPASKSFLGVDGYHDFNYLLGLVGWVPYDGIISALVHFVAYLIMLAALIGMIFLSVQKGKHSTDDD